MHGRSLRPPGIRRKPRKTKKRGITMKATWNTKEGHINTNHRKEDKFYKQLSGLVFDNGKFREAVTLRLYATDARIYACVWMYSPYTAGSDYAGGYGYHRASAAAESAFHHAGITFDEGFGGRGDSAMREAVAAACEMQFPGLPYTVVEAYG